MIGAAFGLGFIIGPAAGGALSVYGYAVPAFVAAALATLNLIAVFLWLPESLTAAKRAEIAKRASRASFSLSALWTALNRPRVGPLFNIRFFFGLAFAIFQTVFALYAQYRFNLSAAQTGFILTYVGVLSVIVQGGAIGWLSKKFDEKTLIFTSTILMAIGLLGWAVAPTIPVLLIIMIPTALGGGTLNTVLNSSLTKAVYPEEVGGTLGLSASLESATRVIAPSIGGFLLGQISTSAPGFFATAIMLGVIVFTWRRIVANPDPPLPARSAAVGKASA